MPTATKVRLRFAKRGNLRLVSHHDLMRCLERMVRRARIPLASSQGFSPRPKIVFALALGLGIEGLDEVVDLELTEPAEPAELVRRLTEVSPPGLDWTDGVAMPAGSPPPRPVAVEYGIQLPPERRAAARAAVESLLAAEQRFVTRRRPDRQREQSIDLRPFLLTAEVTDGGLLMARLAVGSDGSARPEELLESLGLRDLLELGGVLMRTRVELNRG